MTFTDLLDEYGVSYFEEGEDKHSTSGWIQLACPFCDEGDSDSHHLGYSIQNRICSCWRCGPIYLSKVIQAITGKSYRECKELISSLPADFEGSTRKTGTLKIPPSVGKLQSAHKKYLRSRGFDPENLAKVWGVGGIGVSHRLSWTVFIPITYRGEVVSWTTRRIGDPEFGLRYESAKPEEEAIHHKDLLYGEDMCRFSVGVFEGPFDVWRAGPGATCTFGVGFTQAQVGRIARFPKRTVCFDAEPKAQERARELCSILHAFPGVTNNVCLESGKDMAEASEEEVREFRDQFLK